MGRRDGTLASPFFFSLFLVDETTDKQKKKENSDLVES